ncbi:MAG TPA: PBP1A family penicillin-binding protein [Myxococcota bacterium]|jgi:penicillin-binding protein 1A
MRFRLAGVLSRALRILLAAGGLLALVGIGAALGVYLVFVRDLPDLRSLSDYHPALASRVVDRHGQTIGEFFSERRRLTPLESVPPHVVNAFVAGEDSAFFEHKGIDFSSILRAAWVNLRTGGEIKQGGSTITQQMVKGLLLSPERTYRRKIRELILAWNIERHFSKQEILYLYLNQIYFGHGAYGIGEAAETYFGKDVSQLSVSEGAQLAGLPKAPSRYSPYANPEAAEQRRRYVLDRMLEEQLIDATTHAAAVAELPRTRELTEADQVWEMAYFTEEVRRRLFDALGSDVVLRGGLVIETTLDSELQRAAVAAVRRGLVELDQRQAYRGPLRKLAAAAIEAELLRIGEENGLIQPAPAAEEAAASPAPPPPPAATPAAAPGETWAWPVGSRKGARPIDSRTGKPPLLGVVRSVDRAAQIARVAFAPGREAVVTLADVSWAREPDPDSAPHPVESIERVFRAGDVARFLPVETAAANPDGGLRRVMLFQEPTVEGALLSFDAASGEILALVGGWDFDRSQFDRATQARRQPGSAFKPIIYAAALAKGYTASSILYDRPVVYVDETSGFVWRPQNYGKSFYGPITLREALARSVNNATVHLFRDIGVDYVISFARSLGIQSPLQRDLSLALGSSGLSLLELTRAYGVFAAGGHQVVPTFIRRVTDGSGQLLLEKVALPDAPLPELPVESAAPIDVVAAGSAPPEAAPGLSPDQAYLATDLLRAVITDPQGTGGRARELGRPIAGKTGTTNEQADAWFIGYSPDVVTGVWVGHDESRFLGWGETGARAALPIWMEYMHAALDPRPARDFPVPEAIVFARIDRKTGLLADASSSNSVFQAYLAGAEPTESVRAAEDTSESSRQLRMDSF